MEYESDRKINKIYFENNGRTKFIPSHKIFTELQIQLKVPLFYYFYLKK